MGTSTNSLAEPGTATLTFASPLVSLAQHLAARGSCLWTAYWDYHLRRATVRMLQALDDRTLRDIGLVRSEIGAAVFGPSADRLRGYDPHWRGAAPE